MGWGGGVGGCGRGVRARGGGGGGWRGRICTGGIIIIGQTFKLFKK